MRADQVKVSAVIAKTLHRQIAAIADDSDSTVAAIVAYGVVLALSELSAYPDRRKRLRKDGRRKD